MDLTSLHRFRVAPGYDPAHPENWVWTDRSADVNHPDFGAAVTITGDRADEVSDVNPGSALLQVDNAGGHYCDQNPLGRWYGLLDIGCPARWGTISGSAKFTANATSAWPAPDVGTSWSLTGTASNWSSSGGTGQWSVATANTASSAILIGADARNGDAVYAFTTAVTATGASLIYNLQARYTDSSDHILFSAELGVSGVVNARIRRQFGGVLTDLANVVAPFTYTTGQRMRLRCNWDGGDLRVKVWVEASGEPATWTATATDGTCTGSGVAIRLWRVVGNTNAGTVTFTVDDFEVEAVEIVGTIPALPVEWDDTAGQSWAPLEIAGITRRLSQGEDAVRSPIYRQLAAQPAAGYWPLEDGANALSASSGLPGGLTAFVNDGFFGSADCPPGASSALALNTVSSSRIVGRITTWSLPLDGYAAMCYLRIPTPPGTEIITMDISAVGSVARWVVYTSATTVRLEGYDTSGNLTINPVGNTWVIDPTKWLAVQLEASESGATVSWALIWHQVGGAAFFSSSGSFSGTADRLNSATVLAACNGMLVSNLWLGDDLLPFVDSTFMAVSAGYAGELAAARVARLCRDDGVKVLVETGTSEPLGAQKAGGFLDLLRECEAGDQGVLYEAGSGLGYRPRGARYNRPVQMALTIAPAGDITDAPQPTKDDQRIRNQWTLSRPDGGERTSSDAASIARRGLYAEPATVNVNSEVRLQDQADWRVHLGTWNQMRWTQISISLTDRPALLTAWRGRPFGARITITGVPTQGPIGRTVSLIVEGWTQTITSASWDLVLNCSPAELWDVGIYGTSRYDSASTTLASGATAVATTLSLSTVNILDVWDVAGGYDLAISGERITVPPGGMSAASGTGPYTQTITGATRAVNGISKALPANVPVHLADQARYAL